MTIISWYSSIWWNDVCLECLILVSRCAFGRATLHKDMTGDVYVQRVFCTDWKKKNHGTWLLQCAHMLSVKHVYCGATRTPQGISKANPWLSMAAPGYRVAAAHLVLTIVVQARRRGLHLQLNWHWCRYDQPRFGRVLCRCTWVSLAPPTWAT